MKSINGDAVEIRGWTQHASDGIKELSFLEIEIGGIETKVKLDMSSDDLVAWCEKHDHIIRDVRDKDTKAA